MAPIKHTKIVDAEITDDGHVIIEFNVAFRPDTRKCLFTAEALLDIAEGNSEFIDPADTDFPDIPRVDLKEEADDADDEDSDDEEEQEESDGKE